MFRAAVRNPQSRGWTNSGSEQRWGGSSQRLCHCIDPILISFLLSLFATGCCDWDGELSMRVCSDRLRARFMRGGDFCCVTSAPSWERVATYIRACGSGHHGIWSVVTWWPSRTKLSSTIPAPLLWARMQQFLSRLICAGRRMTTRSRNFHLYPRPFRSEHMRGCAREQQFSPELLLPKGLCLRWDQSRLETWSLGRFTRASPLAKSKTE